VRRVKIMAGIRRTAEAVGVWHDRRRGRAELARMSLYELSDIGISPGEALFEAGKPFWRP
jgi:uncharacterized protein YjiS (DUF1127 family)